MRLTAAAGAVVFLLALARSLADGFGLVDESWFLQVVARFRAGDVLYRDVFLGVTPLSLYATSAVASVLGIEILAVKVVTNACFAVTTALSWQLSRRAGLSRGASWAIMAALFVWGRPYGNPPYTPMAMMLFLAAVSASLSATDAGPGRTGGRYTWGMAGALAGLSFAAKQNVGLLALLAAAGAAAVAAGGWRAGARRGFAVTGGFLVAATIVLLPVALSGGLPALWEYGFAAKGSYLRVGGVPWTRSLDDALQALIQPGSIAASAAAGHHLVVALPLAVLIVAAARARRLDRLDWLWVLVAGTATAVALPRWDRFHMAYAVPVHLVALGRMARHVPWARPGPLVRRSAAAALVAALLLVAARPVAILAWGDRRPASLPHFRAAFLEPAREVGLADSAARLRTAARGGPVLLLTMEAGFWYLASGIRNPTPFDIPARTSVGSGGVSWLLAQLENGQIETVCLDNRPPDSLTLAEVDAYVRRHFARGDDVGPCTIHRAARRTSRVE